VEPTAFTHAFAKTVPITPGATKLLEVGCGCGVVGLYCLIEKKANSVTFNDLRSDWLSITRANVEAKIKECAIDRSQVAYTAPVPFTDIRAEDVCRHTLILFNPPQLPTVGYSDSETLRKIKADPVERDFRLGESDNPDGLAIAREFFRWFADLKQPKPDAVVILWSVLGRSRISKAISSCQLNWEILYETPMSNPLSSVRILKEVTLQEGRALDKLKSMGWKLRRRSKPRNWAKKLLTIRLTDIGNNRGARL
jgi:methylase of polypeptide subunit release factors